MSEPLFPTRILAATLRRAVARTAAAALLARYWPERGSRDEVALALVGWLVTGGWTDGDAEMFILAAARAAQDEEWKKRAGKVAHTRATLAEGRPVMGVNALAERLRGGAAHGAMVVAMVAQWLGMPKPSGSKQSPVLTVFTLEHEHGEHGLDQGLDSEDVGTLFSEVSVAPVRWLWPGRVPLGKLTILDGDPGLGKSLITLDLIARVTTGRGMPATTPDEPDSLLQDVSGEPHGAVLLSAEDGLGDTIAPRLLAAGADLSRTLALQTLREVDMPTGTTYERGFLLPRDLERLARAIERMGAQLVVIDPLMAFLDPSVNSFRDQDARLTPSPLSHLAQETGAPVLILRHLNKSAGGNALYLGGGSIGFIGAVRSGLVAAKDPDSPEHRRVLASSKSNLGPPLPALRYQLVVEGGQTQPHVEWLGTCEYTADALLAASAEEQPAGAVEEAIVWLEEQLALGPRRGEEIEQLAAQAGISVSTLRRARERRCIADDRAPFLWTLRAGVVSGKQEG